MSGWGIALVGVLLSADPQVGSVLTCDKLRVEFDAKSSADQSCATDAECACHPDIRVDGRLVPSSKKVAEELTRLAERYRKLKCPTIFASSASPPRCEVRCEAMRCTVAAPSATH